MRNGREAVRKSIDESLAKLKTGYIDLLLIHWPVKDCVKDTWQVMENYVRQGKVKYIGVSNFNRHHLDDLLTYAEIRPVINQIEVHPFMTQEEDLSDRVTSTWWDIHCSNRWPQNTRRPLRRLCSAGLCSEG